MAVGIPIIRNSTDLPGDISQIDPEIAMLIVEEERRLVCRRIQHLPVLEELRSSVDRRRHSMGSAEFQLHIDEEV